MITQTSDWKAMKAGLVWPIVRDQSHMAAAEPVICAADWRVEPRRGCLRQERERFGAGSGDLGRLADLLLVGLSFPVAGGSCRRAAAGCQGCSHGVGRVGGAGRRPLPPLMTHWETAAGDTRAQLPPCDPAGRRSHR